MLKAVIFDMDGVIVDSEPLHVRGERETLRAFGIEATDRELQAYIGRSAKLLFEDFSRKKGLRVPFDEIRPVYRQTLMRLFAESVELVPGVVALFESLKSSGIALALASSSFPELIRSVLDKFSLGRYFRVVVSGTEVSRPKPEPDIFLETLKRLGLKPDECVVIEDSTAGVEAAYRAGIPSVGFRNPNSHGQDLGKAALVADSMHSIDPNTLAGLVQHGS